MIKNLVFDFGSVLVTYNMHWLYDRIFGDPAQTNYFSKQIINEEWVSRIDIGDPLPEVLADMQKQYPDYAEAIGYYDSRFMELMGPEVEGMRELLTDYKSQGYHLYGLSNWSSKVYEVMPRYPIFNLLEGFVISSDVRLLKPDPLIYHCLLNRFHLKAEECVFTDDRPENVAAARDCGLHGVVFGNAAQCRAEFDRILNENS